MMKKGIILAGGAGSRLFPLTRVASKQLQPIYDKPMIYYPLTTLMLGGIQEICIISTPHDTPRFRDLLGDGRDWGLNIEYRVQPEPNGIAQAFLIAEDFIGADPITLLLGDNVFYGSLTDLFKDIFGGFAGGGHVFAYRVHDPERYGVVEFDEQFNVLSIEEKPKKPKSHYAIPGLYLFDNNVIEICKNMKPSARGELEITDVSKTYLERGQLRVSLFGRGTAWLDTGTSTSLHEASQFIATIEKRQGTKVGCPEEVAFRKGFITLEQFEKLVAGMPNCEYTEYLRGVLVEYNEVGR
jgi:glucose-1-phosphate thymidylyltransferase